MQNIQVEFELRGSQKTVVNARVEFVSVDAVRPDNHARVDSASNSLEERVGEHLLTFKEIPE
jgi:hypothetical protein